MTAPAETVYGLQGELRAAEHRLDQVAREWQEMASRGAPVGTQDYLDGPEARLVERLRAEVAAAQDEIGGVVYRVPAQNVEALWKKLATLDRRCAKNGLPPLSYTTAGTDVVEHKDGTAETFKWVLLKAEPVKLAGWLFLAKLTIEEGGVLLNTVPGFARAWALHREGRTIQAPDRPGDEISKQADAAMGEMDLGRFRNEETASNCEHCGKARRRTATYLVEHVETGEIKQVGSNCLRDFLGTDPHATVRYAEWLADLDESMGSDGEFGGGSGKTEVLVETFVTHVATMLRTNGWCPVSGSDYPTKSQARDNIFYSARQKHDKQGHPMWVDVSDEDRERATAAIEWARETLGAQEDADGGSGGTRLSEFDRNMLVAVRGTFTSERTEGILAYLPVAHSKALEREIERREQKRQDAESEWVGSVGERITVKARVTGVFEHGGNDGTTFITTLRDEPGNIYKWFGSYELDLDTVYEGVWTVKQHDEWKGTKQTVLNRPSKLAPVGDDEKFYPGDLVFCDDRNEQGTVLDYREHRGRHEVFIEWPGGEDTVPYPADKFRLVRAAEDRGKGSYATTT